MVPRQLSWMLQGAWGLLVGQGHSPQLSPTPRGPWGLCRKHHIPAHTHNVVVVGSALLVMELEGFQQGGHADGPSQPHCFASSLFSQSHHCCCLHRRGWAVAEICACCRALIPDKVSQGCPHPTPTLHLLCSPLMQCNPGHRAHPAPCCQHHRGASQLLQWIPPVCSASLAR